MTPVISVVMAVYNAERYLREAMDSILNQSFGNFEFVIINDASTDTTDEIIKSYKDKRIKYIINKENIGQTKSLNIGIKNSPGKYIARMDADDISLPDRFLHQIEFLEKNLDIGVVGTWFHEIDENSKISKKYNFPPVTCKHIKSRLITSSPLSWPYIAHPTVMIRKDVLDDVGLYNEKYYISQDYDLWIRISRKHSIANIPKVLLMYRIHKGALTKAGLEKAIKETEDIVVTNINHHLPDLSKEEKKVLLNMLMFRKQNNSKDGEKVFVLFDRFYRKVMADEIKEKDKVVIEFFNVTKLYYLPRLISTNWKLTLKTLLEIFPRYPKAIFSKRFIGIIKHSIFTKW